MIKAKVIKFCEMFYASHYIPTFIYDRDNNLVAQFSVNNDVAKVYNDVAATFSTTADDYPNIFSSAELGLYGILTTSDKKFYVVIGPTFNCEITEHILHSFIHANEIVWDKQDDIAQFLGSLPQYSYNQFINLLTFLHFQLTGEDINVAEHFNITNTLPTETVATQQVKLEIDAKENRTRHDTHDFEQQMLALVRHGETEKLHSFLMNTLKTAPLTEGKLADNLLRQAKNLLIGAVTMVGKVAAIKGGLDVEQTYQLIDAYIQECERCQSVDAVKTLQYNMVIDFTDRVNKSRTPTDINPDIHMAVQFIKTHTNALIGIDDIANYIGKSRSWLTKKFRDEMDTTISSFIMHCKLEEAKRLLSYTDRSLIDISNYLNFSSQSYFQNMFKKEFGTTPAKHREQTTKK